MIEKLEGGAKGYLYPLVFSPLKSNNSPNKIAFIFQFVAKTLAFSPLKSIMIRIKCQFFLHFFCNFALIIRLVCDWKITKIVRAHIKTKTHINNKLYYAPELYYAPVYVNFPPKTPTKNCEKPAQKPCTSHVRIGILR